MIGLICVRYIKIYFGLLTFAFGMLFHSFLMKFYYFTGGDEGMRVLRPYLLGFDLSAVPKMQFLIGKLLLLCFCHLSHRHMGDVEDRLLTFRVLFDGGQG